MPKWANTIEALAGPQLLRYWDTCGRGLIIIIPVVGGVRTSGVGLGVAVGGGLRVAVGVCVAVGVAVAVGAGVAVGVLVGRAAMNQDTGDWPSAPARSVLPIRMTSRAVTTSVARAVICTAGFCQIRALVVVTS